MPTIGTESVIISSISLLINASIYHPSFHPSTHASIHHPSISISHLSIATHLPLIHYPSIYPSTHPAFIHLSVITLYSLCAPLYTVTSFLSLMPHTGSVSQKVPHDSPHKTKWLMESSLLSALGGRLFLEIKLEDEENGGVVY